MNHRNGRKHFGRPTSHREAMFRNMAVSLIREKQITTTLPKAKELRRFLEPLITKAKTNDLQTRRYLIAKLSGNKDAIQALLTELGPHFKTRPGGYLRLLKCGFRAGDAAPMAIVQLVGLVAVEPQS